MALLELARRRLSILVHELERRAVSAAPPDAAAESLVVGLPPQDVAWVCAAPPPQAVRGDPYAQAASVQALLARASQLSAEATDLRCQRVAEAVFNHYARETGRGRSAYRGQTQGHAHGGETRQAP